MQSIESGLPVPTLPDEHIPKCIVTNFPEMAATILIFLSLGGKKDKATALPW